MIPDWMKNGKPFNAHPKGVEVGESNEHYEVVNDCMVPSMRTKKISLCSADTYCFWFESGWANFTINDETGEFFIRSDFGENGYRWNMAALPEKSRLSQKPLTHFLAHSAINNASYVADKLMLGKGRTIIHKRRTIEKIKKELLSLRRKKKINKSSARCAWDDTDDLDFFNINSFRQSISSEIEDVFYKNTLDINDCIVTASNQEFTSLQYKVLPFFFRYLRESVFGEK